jgi:RNA polymerase sigma-70 factor (ECF subfamily)
METSMVAEIIAPLATRRVRPLPRSAKRAHVAADGATRTARADRNDFMRTMLAHQSAIYSAALRLCGNPSDANDLVQDTFERAMRSIEGFTPGTNARGWLLTIVHHLFIDRCRRRRRDPLPILDEEEITIAVTEEQPGPWWATISRQQLLSAVKQLREEFRVVYQMHDLEGRSYNDIVERLQIPKATVGTRLARARRKLRDILTAELAAVA